MQVACSEPLSCKSRRRPCPRFSASIGVRPSSDEEAGLFRQRRRPARISSSASHQKRSVSQRAPPRRVTASTSSRSTPPGCENYSTAASTPCGVRQPGSGSRGCRPASLRSSTILPGRLLSRRHPPIATCGQRKSPPYAGSGRRWRGLARRPTVVLFIKSVGRWEGRLDVGSLGIPGLRPGPRLRN